ncbi:MAG: replication initiation protein [Candidatus Hydrogenedentes bacterium]|nr:replication initiation protein [Candidatus Hydrogenedentota bacterium]
MSRTVAQKTNLDGFPKAGELIEITGAHELEAMDRAALNVLYQHAHDSGRLADRDAEWELPMTALRPSKHESNDRIRDSLDRLMRVIVNVPFRDPKTGEPMILKTHLFDFFELSANEGTPAAVVRFGLPKKLQPILARSGNWGRIRAEVVCSMTSKYAIALYELIQLRANLDKCVDTIPIDRFRNLLGVPPNTYSRGNDFMRFVVEPAALEVNGLTDMGVKMELRRAKGPRSPIVAVSLAWWRKEGDDYRAALQERQRSKVGRMARLRGRVETVAD